MYSALCLLLTVKIKIFYGFIFYMCFVSGHVNMMFIYKSRCFFPTLLEHYFHYWEAVLLPLLPSFTGFC